MCLKARAPSTVHVIVRNNVTYNNKMKRDEKPEIFFFGMAIFMLANIDQEVDLARHISIFFMCNGHTSCEL